MRVVSDRDASGTANKHFDHVDSKQIPYSVRQFLEDFEYPLDDVVELMRKITLVKSNDSYFPGAWTKFNDAEDDTWWVVVPKEVRKAWSSGRREGKGLVAKILGKLMLSTTEPGSMALNIEADPNHNDAESVVNGHHLYRKEGTDWAEYSMVKSNETLTMAQLSTLLIAAAQIENVAKVRRCIDINGTRYGQVGQGLFGPLTLAQNEVPEFSITTKGPDLAYKYIRPVVGEECYDLICMAWAYALVALEPENYFIASDSGGTGKTTLFSSYCTRFNTISARLKLKKLNSKDEFAAGVAFSKLIGKRVAFLDEAGKLSEDDVAVLSSITSGDYQTARFGNSKYEDFYCRAVLFIATNMPDELPDMTAVRRRRVNIDLNNANPAAWHNLLSASDKKLLGRSDVNNVHDYAAQEGRCIDEMVARGMGLLLERQKTTKGMNPFTGLSMDGKTSSRDAFDAEDPSVKALAEMLYVDPEVKKWLEPGNTKKSVNTRITSKGKTAESLLPTVKNPERVLEMCGVEIQAGRRQINGKVTHVILLRDRDKAQLLWDMLDVAHAGDGTDAAQLAKVFPYYRDGTEYNNLEDEAVAMDVNKGIQTRLGTEYEARLKRQGQEPRLIITKNGTVLADLHLLRMNGEKPQPGEDAIRIRPYGETTVFMSDEPGKNAPGLLIQRIRNGEAIGHRKA